MWWVRLYGFLCPLAAARRRSGENKSQPTVKFASVHVTAMTKVIVGFIFLVERNISHTLHAYVKSRLKDKISTKKGCAAKIRFFVKHLEKKILCQTLGGKKQQK